MAVLHGGLWEAGLIDYRFDQRNTLRITPLVCGLPTLIKLIGFHQYDHLPHCRPPAYVQRLVSTVVVHAAKLKIGCNPNRCFVYLAFFAREKEVTCGAQVATDGVAFGI